MTDAPSLMTSTEAAEFLGASPTSVKRWADEGALPCVKTVGKHRRFAREDLERFRRDRMGADAGPLDTADASGGAQGWLSDLLHEDSYRTTARLFDMRSKAGTWSEVCERLACVLEAIGAAWERGEISVVQEHLASERLERAIGRVAETLLVARDAPRALLLTPEDEEHTLGLTLVELALRELGWQPIWAGRRTPLAGLAGVLEPLGVKLVAVSASSVADDPVSLRAYARHLAEICQPRGVALVLGGDGAWPDPPPHGARLRAVSSLAEHLPQP